MATAASPKTYANGVVESYTYNKANWITGVTNKAADTVLSAFSYTYYASGNQKSKTDHTGKTTGYAYDNLGRLVRENLPTGLTVSYTYDASGNRTYKQVSGLENYIINYTYDGNNCIGYRISHHGVTTDHVTYSHDANGNLLSETTNTGETTTYRYNRFNQLIGTGSASGSLSYSYNAKGIRTGKQSNLSCISYLLDGGQVATELYGNTVTSVYLYGANRISRIRSHSTDYYLYNAHGDVVQLTNTSGAVTKTYEYDAFGNETVKDIYDGNPFRYCGEYYDTETGTYYLRARYYDPVNGRFTQPDTWEGNYSDPLSLNRYTYCCNNPIFSLIPAVNVPKRLPIKSS